ncbi:ATP-dependent Lon protease [Sporosarcina sp. PTS2304]|uniref:ATP-dependent Lon protease n=1 Tax=Sporosarcina sp. PTS2304 TaxID=2283194 RepID=UPI000E0D60C0|nr:ATP-dependent Lon protease [Sporosarcina sp. PTS2304]AXH99045.1 ATP-dependent Lon protease [Sporosarcina sp. PTS2304]
MKGLLSGMVAVIAGVIMLAGPVGIYIVGLLLIGIIFWSFLLLLDIHKHTVPATANDAKDAYERYMIERAEKEANE